VLVQLEPQRHVFLFTMHHIISDGWSMEVFTSEVLTLYNAYRQGRPNPLPALRIQYKDYAVWLEGQLDEAALGSLKSYWQGQLSGWQHRVSIPLDAARPTERSYQGERYRWEVEAGLSAGFEQLCQQQGVSLFMGLLAVVKVLLYRYTLQEDILIGTPIAGREHKDLENQIGFYLNSLALRTVVDREESFVALLGKVRETTLGAYEHQFYPFDLLVEDLDVPVDKSHGSPLFDIEISLIDSKDNEKVTQSKQMDGIVGYESESWRLMALYDMSFIFTRSANKLISKILYDRQLFSPDTVAAMARHLDQIMQSVIDDPNQSLIDIRIGEADSPLLSYAAEPPRDEVLFDL
jgi:hypothetical protein